MKTKVYNTEIEISFANALTSGHGHKKVTVEVNYLGQTKEFTAITNNMPGYDDASELEGSAKHMAFYELVEDKIQDNIFEFISEVNESNS